MHSSEIISFYTYLQSQQTAQQFLYQCYKKRNIANAEKKSLQNCNAFMFYLEHGQQFYASGKASKTLLQPLLYFYGMSHLLKACLLTKRPDYPESTSMLAHGVSTRKRKKKDYTFMHDEVKIQQHGLFPYFSRHLYGIQSCPFEKIKMTNLLAMVPELSPLFHLQEQDRMVTVSTADSRLLRFSDQLLDNYHLTEKTFLQRIKPYLPKIVETKKEGEMIQVRLEEPPPTSFGPFFFHGTDQTICFPLYREYFVRISEVMVHYLLLYNLSMLSRYETEWWGDLLAARAEADYPFICAFLQHTSEKVPQLLGAELMHSTRSWR